MKKWNVLITAHDGRKFYQNFHVVELNGHAAEKYLLENFPDDKLKPSVHVEGIEEMEDAEFYLPGIVYKSGKAYFSAGPS